METGLQEAKEDETRGVRRIVDLKVNEVSVVDRPAIQREFLIRKRLEDGDMGALEENEKSETAEVTKAEIESSEETIVKVFSDMGFDFVEISKLDGVKKQIPEELKSALSTVVPSMRRMAAQANPEERQAIMRVAAFLSNVQGGRFPFPQNTRSPAAQASSKADDPKEAAKSEVTNGSEEPKQKALTLDEQASAFIQVDEDGQLHFVTKSGKAFTARRTQALTEASTKLLEMLREVDEKSFQGAMQRLVGKELPKDPTYQSGVRPVPTKKSVETEEAPPAWATQISKQIAAQNERLEAIEKARSPSTSVEAAGGTDDPQKVRKSLWSDVLF